MDRPMPERLKNEDLHRITQDNIRSFRNKENWVESSPLPESLHHETGRQSKSRTTSNRSPRIDALASMRALIAVNQSKEVSCPPASPRTLSYTTTAPARSIARKSIGDTLEYQHSRSRLRNQGMQVWMRKHTDPEQFEFITLHYIEGLLSWTDESSTWHQVNTLRCTILRDNDGFAPAPAPAPAPAEHRQHWEQGTPSIVCDPLIRCKPENDGRSLRLSPLNVADFNVLWSLMLWVQCRKYAMQPLDGDL